MFTSVFKEVIFQSWHKKLHDIEEVLVISCWDETKENHAWLDLKCPEEVIKTFMNPEELKRGTIINVEVKWYQQPFHKESLNFYTIGEVTKITDKQ